MDNKENTNTPLHEEDLGLAGKLTKSFMHNPLTLLLLLACFAIGLAGLILTPRQEDPQISVPMVDIYIGYPGGSSTEVASLVAEPLERIMSEIPGVKHVYSASMHGKAMVTVQFEVGEKMGDSLVKLYDKLQSNIDKMPPGATMPLVKPKGVDDVPMMTLTFWSKQVDDAALRLIALDVMQELNEIADTSQSFIVSGRKEELRIEVKPERLSGYGLSLQQIANTIASANTEQTVGGIEAGRNTYDIITGSFLSSSDEIERLVVAIKDGNPVYLRDVANVFHGPSETNQMVNYYTGPSYKQSDPHNAEVDANGEAAVTLALAKKSGTNGVAVAKAILERLELMKGRLIPGNINVEITRDYGESANNKVNGLMFKLVIVTIAVSVLIWYFLNWRAALVVFIVIPNVILVTVFIALIAGYTIDRVSLFALIFAIGILVDDAIVVIENMYRRWGLEGKIEDSTTIDAVREVGNPTILATFTVIAALLPMAAVRGMMGPYMEPIPALGSVAMMYSLFAAFVYTPYLALIFRPSMSMIHDMEKNEHKTVQKLDKLYRRTLTPLIEDRKKGYIFLFGMIFVFFVCVSLFYTKSVRVKMMPLDNKPEFNVVINFPEGTALPVTANLTRQLTEIVRKQEEVVAIQTYVGTASPFNFNGLVRHYYTRNEPWQADIQIQLVNKKLRNRTSHQIAVVVRKELHDYINQQVESGFYLEENKPRIQVVEMPPGPPVLQSIVAEVYGPSDAERRKVAADLTQMFEKAEYIDDVDNLMTEPNDIWKFKVDREKALRAGVSVDTINKTLEMAMGGYVLGDVKDGSILEPTMIVLQVPLDIRSNFGNLTQLPVPTNSGSSIPLSELGSFTKSKQDLIIFHKDLRSLEYVTGETVGRLSAPIYGMFEVNDMLEDYTGPRGEKVFGNMIGAPSTSDTNKGVAFEWGGEWTVTYETFRDMGMAFGIAVILIYMLVVWEFGNFILPAIIISPIPLTLVGIVPGHWLMDAEFTATSMIGFIALAGIIVRNSILLVDYTREQISLGVEADEAIVMACITRTRPIIITALALVVGSTAILMDPIFQGMAISLMFGVMVSTLLTLFVIPLGCSSAKHAFPVGDGGNNNNNNGNNHNQSAPSKVKPTSTKSKVSLTDQIIMVVGKVLYFTYTAIEIIVSWSLLIYRLIKSLLFKEEPKKSVHSSSPTSSKVTNNTSGSNASHIKPAENQQLKPVTTASTTVTSNDTHSATENKEEKSVVVDSQTTITNEASTKAASKKTDTQKSATKKSVVKKPAPKKPALKKPAPKKTTTTKKAAVKQSVPKKKATSSVKKGRRGIRLKGDIQNSSDNETE
ncbi:MAG: efflux RND transporter permease subunit [Gammaproteobacteria bacterium]|nr:efflux RND transporter permease subunit [Gammaproteobacteria bacterium]